MRILIAHNRYQQKGGEDVVAAAESALLSSHGHEVQMLIVNNDHIRGPLSQIGAAVSSVYGTRGVKLMDEALKKHRPDVVHVHNFFPSFSPAIFERCRAAGVPVVHTLHNYRIQCSGALMYRDGHACEECIEQRSGIPGVRHACYRDSHLGSAVSALTMAVHARAGTWSDGVSAYISLSAFIADKLGRWRIPREKIHIKPNFMEDPGDGEGGGGYALFIGRLSPEKGLQTLIAADAAGRLPMDVIVLGDGPMRAELEQAASHAGSRLKPKGFCSRDTILEWMNRAELVIVPSLGYEAGTPLVAIEAFSRGVPVLASEVGSLPITVHDRGCGFTFPGGDASALADAFDQFAGARSEHRQQLRENARREYVTEHTPERNYTRLMEIYGLAGA